MQKTFYPSAANPNIQSDLGFFAVSVLVSSGANWLVIGLDQQFTVPPGVSGMVVPIMPTQTAAVTLTPPPAGQPPLGPPQTLQSIVTYTDQPQNYTPGVAAQPQTIVEYDDAETNGQIFINMGLARGFAIAIWTDDGNPATINIFGRAGPLGKSFYYATNQAIGSQLAPFFLSAGEGTTFPQFDSTHSVYFQKTMPVKNQIFITTATGSLFLDASGRFWF